MRRILLILVSLLCAPVYAHPNISYSDYCQEFGIAAEHVMLGVMGNDSAFQMRLARQQAPHISGMTIQKMNDMFNDPRWAAIYANSPPNGFSLMIDRECLHPAKSQW